MRTRAHAVKIAHQSLYNTTISSLTKALPRRLIKGCPNKNQELVEKYLKPSPIFVEPPQYHGPAPMTYQLQMNFVLWRLPIKYQVLYNDLTGNFPFMSIDRSVCFFVMYHYETNACKNGKN